MSKCRSRRVVIGMALVATVGLPSCQSTAEETLDELRLPTATLQELEISMLSMQGVEWMAEVEVTNPYDRPLSLTLARYALEGQNGRLLEGRSAAHLAATGRLDLEHLSSEVGQQPAGQLGALSGEIHDANAGERRSVVTHWTSKLSQSDSRPQPLACGFPR